MVESAIVAIMIIAVALVVPTSKDPESTPLDPVGAVLSIIGLVSLVFGIIEGPEQGWTTGPAPIAFAVAALGLGLFVVWELRSEHPMLDPRFFKDRRFTLGSLTITVAFFGIFGMFFTLTQFLQFVQDHDALGAGLRILPYGLVLLAVSPRAADLAGRFGAAKVMVVGMVIAAMGFATLATLEPQSSYLPMAVGLTLAALGTGLLMPPATTALVTSLPPSKAGVGSAMNDTTRELGGAIGIAVVGALMSIGYRNGIDDATDALDAAASETAADSLGGLLRVSSELEPAAADALTTIGRQAFTDGLQLGMFTAAGLLVATAALVAALHPRTDHPQAATGNTMNGSAIHSKMAGQCPLAGHATPRRWIALFDLFDESVDDLDIDRDAGSHPMAKPHAAGHPSSPSPAERAFSSRRCVATITVGR